MEIDKNLHTFMNRCCSIVGQWESDCFGGHLVRQMTMASMIEKYLFVAMTTIARIYVIDATITSQHPCEQYKADFLVSCGDKKVIVECDSQAFHDRTEQERRYEKMRERIFVKSGYTVMHFTGKEILENPFFVASEVLGFVSNIPLDDLIAWVREYDEHA